MTARKLEGGEARNLPGLLACQPLTVPAEAWLEIRVSDTGVEIGAEDLPRLFRDVPPLETTQDRGREGTSLGRALSKRLVELHGGRIWAESAGGGEASTFTRLLPFAGPSASREANQGRPGPRLPTAEARR